MNVIITGATGMVGKGALLECIDDPTIDQVLIINRNPMDIQHPKVVEVIHKDFRDFSEIESQLNGYDACFHCMGVSSAGMSEEAFTEITYTMSKALATTLFRLNPDMVFHYVSGTGTDSTEKGNTMWARVKGKTENMILDMGFRDAYAFRPGVILPERGIQSRTRLYAVFYVLFRPFFPLLRRMKSVTTTTKVGRAMINLCKHAQALKHLEGADINQVADIR